MINITIAQLKSDIAGKMKGTSIRQIKDFYSLAFGAANRMLARIDTQETIRTVTMSTPFFDNIVDYALVSDYKRMIDIRPQVNRQGQPGLSHYTETTPRQFLERLDSNSYSIRWNSMVRSLRSQRLPMGNTQTLDTFDGPSSNGLWVASGDSSGLYTEVLNYVNGNGSLGMSLSGATGSGSIENSTASVTDLSQFNWEDAAFMYVWIPTGKSSLFTSFKLRRGSSSGNYREVTVATKADGTVFTDGWNLLMFDWNQSTTTGSPDNTKNTYRKFIINYTSGTAVNGFLVDSLTDALGQLGEIEYYSEYLFRSSTGIWKSIPTDDSDLVNVGPNSYEILQTEMMVDVEKQIRQGNVMTAAIADWRLMLNGQPQSRYVKDPPYHGLYADYLKQFPSSAIITSTKTYDFDV